MFITQCLAHNWHSTDICGRNEVLADICGTIALEPPEASSSILLILMRREL